MRSIAKAVIGLFIIVAMASCGGGGGGGSSSGVHYVAGTYAGTLAKSSQSCPVLGGEYPLPASLTLTSLVNQKDNQIIINQGSLTLEGSVTSANSLEASESQTKNGCLETFYIKITNIKDTSANEEATIAVSCATASCDSTYDGPVTRTIPTKSIEAPGPDSLDELAAQMSAVLR